jgi:hypothetical protein
VRVFRLLLAPLLVATAFAVPSRAVAPPPLARAAVGSVAGSLTRTYAVPPGTLLAGVTWRSGTLAVSMLRDGAWQPVEAGDDEGATRRGTEPVDVRRLGSLVLRLSGRADGVAVEFADGRASSSSTVAPRVLPRLGSVVTRRGWGADERLRSGRVKYARPRAVVVHHTVTANDYTQAEAASYVRAVYAYHTRSRGYSDIAYNLIVDRFGTVYEGRAGDFARGVVGAHTSGYNTGTLGVSLLGNFDTVALPAEAADAVARAGAWAAERWSFDPRGTVQLGSRTVSRMPGHRDLGTTACPGRYAYSSLPAIRESAWHRLAAVFSPVVVRGAPVHAPEPVTVSATLDHAAAWTATISAYGHPLATATGRGRAVAVSWNGLVAGLPAPPGARYEYALTADDGVHGPSDPVTGSFDVGLPKV